LFGKFSRRVQDNSWFLNTGIGTVTGFPMDLGFQECFFSGRDFRIRFISQGLRLVLTGVGPDFWIWIWFLRIGFGFSG
jgi:hypothetical protein